MQHSSRTRTVFIVAIAMVVVVSILLLLGTIYLTASLNRCNIPLDNTRILVAGGARGKLVEVVLAPSGIQTTTLHFDVDGYPHSVTRLQNGLFVFLNPTSARAIDRGVYHLDVATGDATLVMPLDRLRSPHAKVVSAGEWLFVATTEGLMRIDPRTHAGHIVVGAEEIAADGGIGAGIDKVFFGTLSNELAVYDPEVNRAERVSEAHPLPLTVESVAGEWLVYKVGDRRNVMRVTENMDPGAPPSPQVSQHPVLDVVDFGGTIWLVYYQEVPSSATLLMAADGTNLSCRIPGLVWFDAVVLD